MVWGSFSCFCIPSPENGTNESLQNWKRNEETRNYHLRKPCRLSERIGEKMKTVRMLGDRKSEIIDVPDPEPTDDMVVVKMMSSVVCGTERAAYFGKAPIPINGGAGHEGAGLVWKTAGNAHRKNYYASIRHGRRPRRHKDLLRRQSSQGCHPSLGWGVISSKGKEPKCLNHSR